MITKILIPLQALMIVVNDENSNKNKKNNKK